MIHQVTDLLLEGATALLDRLILVFLLRVLIEDSIVLLLLVDVALRWRLLHRD